jgi:hypothetical protein
MRCGYRVTRDQHGQRAVELHIDSFDYHPIPADYTVCDWPTLRKAWRLKDRITLRRLRREAMCRTRPIIVFVAALWLIGAIALTIGLCRAGKRGERE